MKYSRILILICIIIATILSLYSCNRVKSALGVDRMENAEAGILPENNTSNSHGNDLHPEDQGELSYGNIEVIEKPDEPKENLPQIGEPIFVDHSPENKNGSTIYQYTVTNMQVLDNVSKVANLTFSTYTDENGKIHEKKLEDYADENGNLKDEYIYISVDINVKYVSGFDEPRNELRYGNIMYDYWPTSEQKITQTTEDGLTFEYTVSFDENGEVFKYPPHIGSSNSYWYDGAPKEAGHIVLNIGEETSWQIGVILEKKLVLKHGMIVNIDGNKIVLPIDEGELK